MENINGTYEIEIVDVQSPWEAEEMDFTTLNKHTINLVENIDAFELSIEGP